MKLRRSSTYIGKPTEIQKRPSGCLRLVQRLPSQNFTVGYVMNVRSWANLLIQVTGTFFKNKTIALLLITLSRSSVDCRFSLD